VAITGNITVSGTVDGYDVGTMGAKLAGIEAGATADQTITAGSGLTGGGTGNVTLSHADTSAQASVNNSGATVIQDVTLDTYGHVTALGSTTLTASTIGALPTGTNQIGNITSIGVDSQNYFQFVSSLGTEAFLRVDNNQILSIGSSAMTVQGEVRITGTGSDLYCRDGGFAVGTSTTNGVGTINATGTVTANAFVGDGSGLTGLPAASAKNDIFWENGQTVTSNYTITNGKNAMSAGPITIGAQVTVTVGAGETWTVV
jgi:hypothetical protein